MLSQAQPQSRIIRFLTVVIFVLFSLASSQAVTWRVSPSDDWCTLTNGAKPGDEVVFASGSYVDPCVIRVAGTSAQWITIRSEQTGSQRATFTYSGNTSNVIDMYVSYVVFRDFGFAQTQEDVDAIRIRQAHDLVIDSNFFTGIAGVSVTANDSSTQRIEVRNNTFKNLRSTGIYLGCHDGAACVCSDFVVQGNLIDGVTTPFNPDATGYGMEIKLNSYGKVRDNTVYRTKGPGIMVYGSNSGNPANIVEGNYVEGSVNEGGIVVGGGPAIVRNNVLVGNAFGGVSAQDYNGRGLQQNVWIVHNTAINNDDAGINVESWSAGAGNVIAYNAILPRSGTSSLRPSAPAGTISGNVTCAASCFVNATTAPYDLWPILSSLIDAAGGGTQPWRPSDDFMGVPRGTAADVGAFEATTTPNSHLLGAGNPRPPRVTSGGGDTTAPTVGITAPSAGANLSGTVTVTASASDNVGVVGVQFKVDGNAVGPEDTSAPYSASWNTAGVSNGSHTLVAVARDAAGNTATSASVILTVSNTSSDTTAPTVTITAPPAGSVSGTVSVTANATDNVGVAGVQFKLDGANLGAERTAAPYIVNWDTGAVSPGSHVLSAVARDAAGNMATSAPVNVTIASATADFSLQLTPAIATVAAGQSKTYQLTITPSGGSVSPVTVTCTAPSGLGCSVSGSPVTVGTTAASAQITVTTTARQQALMRLKSSFALAVALPMFGSLFAGVKLRRRVLVALITLSVLALLAGLAACGGSTQAGTQPQPPAPGGTAAGTYSVVIDASSGTTQHSVTATLVVQ